MSTAFQKVSNILQRTQMIQSQNEEKINKAFEMINDEASSPEQFPYMGDQIIRVSKEKEVRWLNAFYSDDTNLLKIYNNCLSTEAIWQIFRLIRAILTMD